MNNLPAILEPIEAYYYDNYTLKLNMYQGYTPSGEINMDVMNWGKVIFTVPGSFSSNQITIELTKEQVQSLPPVAECKVKDDDKILFQVQIKPTKTGQPDNGQSYNVTLSGDTYVAVEVLGMALVEEQVAIATAKATEAAQGAGAAATSAATALEKATEAIQSANVAQTAADKADLASKQSVSGFREYGAYNAQTNTPTLTDDADALKEGEKVARLVVTVGGILSFSGDNFTAGTAVQNYDELRGNEAGQWVLVPGPFKPSDDITVQNYADAVPYFTGDAKRRIYVNTDFAYNEGFMSFYDYTPGKGEAFLGLDFNYKDL